ncbi:hypothetical protein ATCC90586_000821 [Pythium insidiosum]|nr:hypothetical protein ATCC90586_000821 [Pythium insidiosum]
MALTWTVFFSAALLVTTLTVSDAGIGEAWTGIMLSAACLLMYALVGCTNPGIIEPLLEPVDDTYTYCDHCESYRPPSALHCLDCRVCIEEYDHHCPWTGKCIGKRNVRYFYGWLFFLVLAFVYEMIEFTTYMLPPEDRASRARGHVSEREALDSIGDLTDSPKDEMESDRNTTAVLSSLVTTAGSCPARSSFLPVMVSVSSLLGCLYVIATYAYVRALRQHPAGIMFGMSVYGAIYQFLYLLDRSSESVKCSQMAVFVDFFLTGQETYMLIFAIDLLLALKNPFSASKGQMKTYHIVGGLWSISCALLSQFDTHYALFGFCWVNSSGELFGTPKPSGHDAPGDDTAASRVTVTSGIFFAVYIVVVYITSLAALLRTWNTFLKGLPDTFKTRHRIHRHLKYYVVCYFGYWTLVLSFYGAFKLVPADDDPSDGGLRCRIWHLLSCLLLAKGMVNALIWTRTSNLLKIIEQLRTYGFVDLPPHEDSINWALRLEILTNTTKGICESVNRAERQARTSVASSGGDAESCSANHSSSNDTDYFDRKESYSQIEEIILENRNESGRRGQRTEGVVFFDYAPHVFRRLRMEAKISASSYLNSMQQTTKERVSEGKSGAFFYFTEDRKYVVKTMTHEELKFLLTMLPKYYTFIKSHPNTFVTRFFGCHAITMYGKTVFFMVMQSVFDTTLQIHERFDLKGSWVGRLEGRKPTGTVATCKFCGKMYVVGGSHDQLCDVRRGEGNLRHQYDQVGKDLNWNRHMALPQATARAVAAQLIKDSSFLCSINCIDYSLLVGIHHRSFNVSHYSSAESFDVPPRASCCSSFVGRMSGSVCSNLPAKPFHQAIHGGMTVDEVHGPGIYFMGLIDILQQWNLRKRIEHFVRAYILMQDKQGISVVNPKQYADRFQQRVVRELIYDHSMYMDELPSSAMPEQNLDPSLFESGRTASTVLNSFDMAQETRLFAAERSSPLQLPVVSSSAIPVLPLPSTRSSGGNGIARRRAVTVSSTSSLGDTQPIRQSGGFVMEAPRSSYLPSRGAERASSNGGASSSSASSSASANSNSSIPRLHVESSGSEYAHMYSIVRTPTFPDKPGTMSA